MESQDTQLDTLAEIHKAAVESEKGNENNSNVGADVKAVSFSQDSKTFGDNELAKNKENIEKYKEDTQPVQELTDKEIEERKKSMLDMCAEKILALKNASTRDVNSYGASYDDEFCKAIHYISEICIGFKENEVPDHIIVEHRQAIGRALVEHDVVTLMCDALASALMRDDYLESSGETMTSKLFTVIHIILSLLNYSDCNDKVKQIITEHGLLLPLVLKFLSDKLQDYLEKKLNENVEKMCRRFLSLLHNCAALKENVTKLREIDVIKTVLPYLESDMETHRLIVIAILADLVNEEEAELLSAHVSVFRFILKTLEKALATESHRELGWSAEELTRAVKQLARNDANKEILVHKGCLPLLVNILHNGNERELNEAVGCLWALSFNDDNKKRMVEELCLVDRVYKGYQAAVSVSLKKAFHGILWSLRDELVKSEHYKTIGQEIKMRKEYSDTQNSKT